MAAIITGPLQKSALIDADIKLLDGTMFSGHTEFFMQQSGRDKVVMMLANPTMKVALVTTHLALKMCPLLLLQIMYARPYKLCSMICAQNLA